ncbi:MAG: hypothetical protein K2K90_13280 [Lachnospiraceae bacterium]|nr:hypothetical protein [Lachnospiraceae bacterium]
MSRRGDNIRKRIDGRWEGRYRTISESGEIRYWSVYGKSYNKVKEKLADTIHRTYSARGLCKSEFWADDENAVHNAAFCTLAEKWLQGDREKQKIRYLY